MENLGTSILLDADNMNNAEGVEIETAYSLLNTFMDKYDYMREMTNNDSRAYHLVSCASDIYYLIKAARDILYHVKGQNESVQELICSAVDVVKAMDPADNEE